MSTLDNLAHTDLTYRTDVAAGLSGPLAGANKLWLPIWSGEVLHAYDEYNSFEQLVDTKTISSGVAMEFPITGTVSLQSAWNAGVELNGGDASSTTIAIKLDKRPMAAHFETDKIDLMQSQWEFRSELARQAGMTLANARDKQISAYIARAAAEDITFDTTYATGQLTATNAALDPRGALTGPVFLKPACFNLGLSSATAALRNDAALAALQCIEDFFVHLQTINAPTDGVVLAVTPRAFQDIRSLGIARADTGLFGSTASSGPLFGGVAEAGGLGAALKQGMHNLSDALEYQGAMIIKSNHLPIVNYSTSIGEARYNLNFANAGVCGLIFQKNCVASLKLQGLKVDTVDDIRRGSVFTVASMLSGTGVLRPECAAVIIKPTAQNWVVTTMTTEANYADAANGGANANFFYGTAMTAADSIIATYLQGAESGGEAAAKARKGLRNNFEMTRECLATVSSGFPYV